MKNEISFDNIILNDKVEKFSKSFYKALFLKENFRLQFIVFCDDELKKVNNYILTLINQLYKFSQFGKVPFIIKSYLVYADLNYISILFKCNDKTICLNFDLSDCSLLSPTFAAKLRGFKLRHIKRHIRKINKDLKADFDTLHLSLKALKIFALDKKINQEISVKILQKT